MIGVLFHVKHRRGTVVDALHDIDVGDAYLVEFDESLPFEHYAADETASRRWVIGSFVAKLSILDLIAEAAL